MDDLKITYEEELDVILTAVREKGGVSISLFQIDTQTILDYYKISSLGLKKIIEQLINDGYVLNDKGIISISQKGKHFTGYRLKKYFEDREKNIQRRERRINRISVFITIISCFVSLYLEYSRSELIKTLNSSNVNNYNLNVLKNNMSKTIDSLNDINHGLHALQNSENEIIDSLKTIIGNKKPK